MSSERVGLLASLLCNPTAVEPLGLASQRHRRSAGWEEAQAALRLEFRLDWRFVFVFLCYPLQARSYQFGLGRHSSQKPPTRPHFAKSICDAGPERWIAAAAAVAFPCIMEAVGTWRRCPGISPRRWNQGRPSLPPTGSALTWDRPPPNPAPSSRRCGLPPVVLRLPRPADAEKPHF